MEDASSEATVPKPFVYEDDETGGTHMRQEAATPERIPQVTTDPPSPLVDLSYPQQAADPPTPMLEMPNDPVTPVLRLTTTPPITFVLQFTNEDTQDQDTQQQDQSQEF